MNGVPAPQQPAAVPSLPRGFIDGLIFANDTDTVNDLSVGSGICRSTSNISSAGQRSTLNADQRDIEFPTSLVKQLDVAWGQGNGGVRSASAVSNTTWHYYAIGGRGRKDDIWATDSATAATVAAALPSGYTAYRNIFSIVRNASSTLQQFIQRQDEIWLKVPVNDIATAAATNPGTLAVTRTLVSLPTGINVQAIVALSITSATSSAFTCWLSSLDTTDTAASVANAVASLTAPNATPYVASGQFRVWTDTAAAIRSRQDASGASDTMRITSLGWVHPRGKNAA